LDVRTESLKRIAELQESVGSRNYFLSTVVEDWDLVNNAVSTSTSYILLHLDGAMKNLQFHLNPDAASNIVTYLYVDLVDINTIYKLTIRNSILDYEVVSAAGTDGPALHVKDTCDLSVPTDYVCWRFMLAGYFPFASTTTAMVTNGTPQDIVDFFAYFDFQDEADGGYNPNGSK
jgi:alkyl sulfatase BDS1-like metallo-beta-lactamase superfamily hydrolase